MILPIFPILLFYNFSVLLCDFTQMAAVTSLRLYDSQNFEGARLFRFKTSRTRKLRNITFAACFFLKIAL